MCSSNLGVDMSTQAATGVGTCADAFLAGQQAAKAAVDGLAGEKPAIVFVFSTPLYDLTQMLAGIRSMIGDAKLVGATTSGEMVGGDYMGFGAGVSVMALSKGDYQFGLASAANIKGNLDNVGHVISRQAREEAGASPHSVVVMFADCLAGDLQDLFRGAYRTTGPKTPIVGGAASDEMKFSETYVFHDNKVIPSGAVALWIGGKEPFNVMVKHGWEPIGAPLLVTRAEGVRIFELDGRPAATVYEEQLGLKPGELEADSFWQTSVHHPLGLMQADGSYIIRAARSKDEDGTLTIQGCCPQAGSAVQVMSSDNDKLLSVTEEIGKIVQERPNTASVLAFSCAARAMLLGQRTQEEAERLQKAVGGAPVFGAYCCGEFARTSGVLGTHNLTLTALAL